MKIVLKIALPLLWITVSCQFFSKTEDKNAVARVNDTYLYSSEITGLISGQISSKDSIAIVKAYIDRWATQQLLLDASEINISDEQRLEFEKLITQYRNDLYTKAYIEELVKTKIDTIISEDEIQAYYQENKEGFKTSGRLVKLRFINVLNDHPKFDQVKKRFFDFKKQDRLILNDQVVQFKSAALNDSVWVETNQIYKKLPFITPENISQYLISGKEFQYKDSLSTYFIKVNKVLDRNEISPYEYIKPTIKQVILNRKKLEFIKKIEKEIKEDAIKNKKYEIYQ